VNKAVLLSPSPRRRARPSKKTLALSLFVFVGTMCLGYVSLFGQDIYLPLALSLCLSFLVFWLRARNLRALMPGPYGAGRTRVIGTKEATREGLLLAFGGGAALVGLMGSVFFLPPEAFFVLLFGVIAGLPFSQVLFYSLVTRYERKSKARIFFINEETGAQGAPTLIKSIEMS